MKNKYLPHHELLSVVVVPLFGWKNVQFRVHQFVHLPWGYIDSSPISLIYRVDHHQFESYRCVVLSIFLSLAIHTRDRDIFRLIFYYVSIRWFMLRVPKTIQFHVVFTLLQWVDPTDTEWCEVKTLIWGHRSLHPSLPYTYLHLFIRRRRWVKNEQVNLIKH